MLNCNETVIELSDEQKVFIEKAKEQNNILVDACIGSGKTTAIQQLCNGLPSTLQILYLTYNKLLKIDARSKIHNSNVTVTNYHGFAYSVLNRQNIHVGVPDLIQTFIKINPNVGHYDLLLIDEYQDIEKEFADLLECIKKQNPQMQIIAVGDMQQKIYDKTTLDVESFINDFLGEHVTLQFTKCFRLCNKIAEPLGRIWNKTIFGVNSNCQPEIKELSEIVPFLSKQSPKDILCLGSRHGDMSDVLNQLERDYPKKFNKTTVYASISDQNKSSVSPNVDSAIFTTFDSSKGMERKICVVFDYTEDYWQVRAKQPQQSYEILRNIFCVAASRGKERIIFVHHDVDMLSEKTLSSKVNANVKFESLDISHMFEFKYREDIENCFSLLNINEVILEDRSVIDIANHDGLIDLSPCIGEYQEAVFFKHNSVDTTLDFYSTLYKNDFKFKKDATLEEKILFLTAIDTKQDRYKTQVNIPFITEEARKEIMKRLASTFTLDENVQVECAIPFAKSKNDEPSFYAKGLADVVKNDTVYELKFVSELQHEHFLQCACYMVALHLKKGILWNTRDNTRYQISIPDTQKFLNAVASTITKNYYTQYYSGVSQEKTSKSTEHLAAKERCINKVETFDEKYFAVIDTETNYSDEVMSIGIVIADTKSFEPISTRYYLIHPECDKPAMFSSSLNIHKYVTMESYSRSEVMQSLSIYLQSYKIQKIFAYNASFDCKHLSELSSYSWYDIMKIAAFKQYNKKIPADAECYKNGRMKKGYGVEKILQMLMDDTSYSETHNALQDAMDELKIMKLLEIPYGQYKSTRITLGNQITSPKTNFIKHSNDYILWNAKSKNTTHACSCRAPREKVNVSKPIMKTNVNETLTKTMHTRESKQKNKENDGRYDDSKTNHAHVDVENKDTEQLYTVSQISENYGVSKSTIYTWIHKGELVAYKQGNKFIITEKALDDFVIKKRRKRKRRSITLIILCSVLILFYIVMFKCLAALSRPRYN